MQMIACNKEENKWSEKKMGGDDGLRTVECLRGRLLAERQASRTAKEDAELMGSKLVELENKLKEETKLRNKAEKRLKLLRKKLESLKILPGFEESEQSSSSENCAASSSVSSASSSGTKNPEESAVSKSQNAVPEISKNVEENASDCNTSIKSLEISSSEENLTSPGSDTKDSSYENSSSKSSSSHEVPTSYSSLKASTMEINMNGRNYQNYEDDDCVDNSLALVPLNLPETKRAPEINIVSNSIGEVLDTLKHARERIQNSMERRQMIRVGPS